MPNAKVLESKKAVVDALSGKIKEATSVVFVDYKGITVAQDTELRKQFREAGVEYSVVKNTLTNFATKNCGYDFSEVLNGTTAMASTTGDPIAPARIVCDFAKKNKLKTWSLLSWVPSWHLSPAWPLSWIRSGFRRKAALPQKRKPNRVTLQTSIF